MKSFQDLKIQFGLKKSGFVQIFTDAALYGENYEKI